MTMVGLIIGKHFLFLFYLSLCFIGLDFSNVTVGHQQNVSINFCKNNEFQCENRQCIAQPFICDGIPDCDDASDETYNLCRNITCGEQYFRCDYGACINKEYQCDGRQQCSDGSDERKEECDRLTRKFTRTKRASSNSCAVPPASLDRTINYDCRSECDPNSGYVPNLTLADVSCKPNFHLEEGVSPLSVCSGGIWQLQVVNCHKRCDKLNPINVNLRCTRNGVRISCDENSLLAGSKVRPTCRSSHRYADAVAPDYIEITCNENGKWDRRLFQCVPECGRSYLDSSSDSCGYTRLRISGGVIERYGDSPWHVAIYNSNKVLICGGTIIHPYIVLSAAHCFEVKEIFNNNPKDYEVVVSKVTRNYNVTDNDCQQTHRIKEMRASPKGYFGRYNSFTADIVALILEKKIAIGPAVLPACIDWISLSKKTRLGEETLGKVSGWGLNGTQLDPYTSVSEQLKTANLSFITREHCLTTVPKEFRDYVTFDKFCAGKEGGPGVLQGDSGGGFLIPQTNYQKETFYYLRGIVSLKDTTITPIAAFTDLADHYEWILSMRDEIDKNITHSPNKISEGPSGEDICNSYNASNCVMVQNCFIAEALILSKKAIYCGYDVVTEIERICCKMPNPDQKLPRQNESVPQTRVRTSSEIASKYCDEYSRYATDCVTDAPPKGKRVPAQQKEYHHFALIVCYTYGKIIGSTWIGSLISDRFVLSHAWSVCLNKTEIAVRLGGLGISPSINESNVEEYDIEESYLHPNYSYRMGTRHGIVLHKTKIKVEFNSYIRPACLFSLNLDLINTEMRALGWGGNKSPKVFFPKLQKSTITVFDDQICSKCSKDKKSIACAGKVSDGEAVTVVHVGSPLQFLKENTSCMWTLYAIEHNWMLEAAPKSCDKFEDQSPASFTKISYYLDWIQGIVWPKG